MIKPQTIAVVAPSPIPFCLGGAENLWTSLVAELNKMPGIQADLIKLPALENTSWAILKSYQAFSQLRLDHFDTVLVTKYPAWMIKHPNKVLYLQHKLRGLYDTWPESLLEEWPDTSIFDPLKKVLALPASRQNLYQLWEVIEELEGIAFNYPDEWFALPSYFIKSCVSWLDDLALNSNEVKRYATLSQTVAQRKNYFPKDVNVHVIPHPSGLPVAVPQLGVAIFTASRHDASKRLDLLIKAYRLTNVKVPLRIAGEGPQTADLKILAEGDNRIQFLGRIDSKQLEIEYAKALFVPFIPEQEDLGLITIEALQNQKPVMTTIDSGGAAEIVQNQVTGWICSPTPEDLASVMTEACLQPEKTKALGQNGPKSIAHINWLNVIHTLFRRKPKLLLLNTYSIYPPVGGGQLRTYQLYRQLTSSYEITHLALVPSLGDIGEVDMTPGFKEVRIARSIAFENIEREKGQKIKASVGDVMALQFPGLCPAMANEIEQQLKVFEAGYDILILSHPYMYRFIEPHHVDFIYEAHNVEVELKKSILKNSPDLIQLVKQYEEKACQKAQKIISCSQQDAKKLAKLYKVHLSKIKIVQNGTDTNGIQPYPLKLKPQPLTAIFMGSYHGPNNQALEHIFELAHAVTHIRFIVLGSVNHHLKEFKATIPDNLQLLGVVSEQEKTNYLSKAHIAINPVTSGSGTNLKMLEYAAAGLIISSTPFGGRGGILQAGKHFLAHSINEMREWLSHLDYKSLNQYQGLVQQSRKQACDYADWQVIGQYYKTVLQSPLKD